MQRNIKNLQIDFAALRKEIVKFLDQEKFSEIAGVETEKGYKIFAGDSSRHKIRGDISIGVEGNPDDFMISLESFKEEKRHKIPMMLASMFGGGYFLLKDLKSEEALIKFTPIFWRSINIIVSSLQNSATHGN